MAWDTTEENIFSLAWSSGEGQINLNSQLGQFLKEVASDTQYKKYLEIGTWSGMGSTRCLHLGFLDRVEPFVFMSLECNKDKVEMAAVRYKDYPYVQIMNSSIIEPSVIPPVHILKEMFSDLKEEWHSIDMENLATCSIVKDRDFDVVFLDVGEYTTYFEFKELVNSPSLRMIICDDTTTSKCRKVREELLSSSSWKVLIDKPDDRNGWCVFTRR